jgi:hypothetical protein
MWFQSKNKQLGSVEYEYLCKKITTTELDIANLKLLTGDLDRLLRSLRGLINRKLGNSEEKPTNEEFNNPVLVPM